MGTGSGLRSKSAAEIWQLGWPLSDRQLTLVREKGSRKSPFSNGCVGRVVSEVPIRRCYRHRVVSGGSIRYNRLFSFRHPCVRRALNPVSSCLAAQSLLIVRLLVAGLLFLSVGVAPTRAESPAVQSGSATDGPISIEHVEVGLAGLYKVGEWTPLWVTLRSSVDRQVQMTVSVPDSDDNLTSRVGKVVQLSTGAATRIETRFRTGRLTGELLVEVAKRNIKIKEKKKRWEKNGRIWNKRLKFKKKI